MRRKLILMTLAAALTTILWGNHHHDKMPPHDKMHHGAHKICSAVFNTTFRNDIHVMPTWTPADCQKWAKSIGAEYQLGCLTQNSVEYGKNTELPTQNCGW